MTNRRWFTAASTLFLSLFLGVSLAQGQDRHDQDRHDQGRHDHDRFDDRDRNAARDWYHSHPSAFRQDEGRYWRRDWEPNIHEGFVLNRDMRRAVRPVPRDLLIRLGPAPRGYRYVIVGDHVVLVDGGYRIHDVLHFELNF